jgi:hypothetical protein
MNEPVKRRVGRPSKKEQRAADRPNRIPVSAARDKLGVFGKDPNKYYRWVKDKDLDGERLFIFQQAGYQFVKPEEVSVSKTDIHQSEDHGSVIRKSAGQGEYHYLMSLDKDWRESDLEEKSQKVQEQLQDIYPDMDDGYYGDIKLRRGRDFS